MNTYLSYSGGTRLYNRVTDILLRFGVSASSCGYEYIRCAIILAYHNPEITEYATKTLYPKVARLCRAVSSASAERNCRRAVERAISAKTNALTKIFGDITPERRPTCANFILTVANYLHAVDTAFPEK